MARLEDFAVLLVALLLVGSMRAAFVGAVVLDGRSFAGASDIAGVLASPLRSSVLLAYLDKIANYTCTLRLPTNSLRNASGGPMAGSTDAIFVNGNLARVLLATYRLHKQAEQGHKEDYHHDHTVLNVEHKSTSTHTGVQTATIVRNNNSNDAGATTAFSNVSSVVQSAYLEQGLAWCDTFVGLQANISSSHGNAAGYWGTGYGGWANCSDQRPLHGDCAHSGAIYFGDTGTVRSEHDVTGHRCRQHASLMNAM